MQPIERYGLIALVFLVITIAAACLWEPDGDKDAPAGGADAAEAPRASPPADGAEPRPRDFVGARTPAGQGQPLSERQRERLLALQQEEAAAAPLDDEISAREASLARREAALAAREEQAEAPRTHLQAKAQDLLESAAGSAHDVMDLVRPEPKPEHEAAPAPSTKRTYVVAQGDTLSEIASEQLGTWKRWKEIVEANPGLDPEHMRVGARIALPADALAAPGGGAARGTGAKQAPLESRPKAKGGAASYVVRSNDSLWSIAEKTLGDGERWREIAALNPGVDPGRLAVGDSLVVPAAAPRPAPAGGDRVAQAEPAPKRGKVR